MKIKGVIFLSAYFLFAVMLCFGVYANCYSSAHPVPGGDLDCPTNTCSSSQILWNTGCPGNNPACWYDTGSCIVNSQTSCSCPGWSLSGCSSTSITEIRQLGNCVSKTITTNQQINKNSCSSCQGEAVRLCIDLDAGNCEGHYETGAYNQLGYQCKIVPSGYDNSGTCSAYKQKTTIPNSCSMTYETSYFNPCNPDSSDSGDGGYGGGIPGGSISGSCTEDCETFGSDNCCNAIFLDQDYCYNLYLWECRKNTKADGSCYYKWTNTGSICIHNCDNFCEIWDGTECVPDVRKNGQVCEEETGKVCWDGKCVKGDAFKKFLDDKCKTPQEIEEENNGICFVATAVYGDENAPEVVTLREIRDEVLMKDKLGKKFVEFYYSGAGEKTAGIIKYIPGAVPVIRKVLNEVVENYEEKNEIN